MNIHITYKTGNSLTENIDYVVYRDGAIWFHKSKDIENVIEKPTKVPMEAIVSYDVYPDTLEKHEVGFFRNDGSKV